MSNASMPCTNTLRKVMTQYFRILLLFSDKIYTWLARKGSVNDQRSCNIRPVCLQCCRVLALRKDGGLDELNRFECPGPSALFANADVAIAIYSSETFVGLSSLMCFVICSLTAFVNTFLLCNVLPVSVTIFNIFQSCPLL